MIKYPRWVKREKTSDESCHSCGRLQWGRVWQIILVSLIGLLIFGGLGCLPAEEASTSEAATPAASQPDQSISDNDSPDTSLPQPTGQERTNNVADYVEPAHPLVRDAAVFAVQGAPAEIEANSEAWKIWKINYWVANNIRYINDPKDRNYYAFAHETLQVKGGDCDDFAILLASMYEAVGLDAAIASIDTDDDWNLDHMTCLVYYHNDGETFIEEETAILESVGLSIQVRIIYFDPANSKLLPKKYTSGIWVVADPTMAMEPDKIGYVVHKPYKATSVIDIGN